PHNIDSIFFVFNAPATTQLYTLSLHDALPISFQYVKRIMETPGGRSHIRDASEFVRALRGGGLPSVAFVKPHWKDNAHAVSSTRSEEHTSELQSRSDLVCRLLLEKKKNKHN